MEQRGLGSFAHGLQRVALQARCDQGGAPCRSGNLYGGQLGSHAAGPYARFGIGSCAHGQDLGRQPFDDGQVARVRITARVGSVKAVHIRQQDQQIGLCQLGGAGGQTVIVAVADFFGGDGVILIHHGNDAMAEQGLSGGARVQPSATPLGVIARQQNLARDQIVRGQGLFPCLHQQALAHGSGGLFVGQFARIGLDAGAAQCDRTGRYDDDLLTRLGKVGDVFGQGGQPGAIGLAASGVEHQRRADLHHDATRPRQRL